MNVRLTGMHIYFSGIGGTGIGPLALIAKQAGYSVSGSDSRDSQYITYLRSKGLNNIQIGQTKEQMAAVHAAKPIDWVVYSSALPKENPEHPELSFAKDQGIKHTKRDEFLNYLLREKNQKMIAVAGTHGKSTTTAMLVWLFKQLGLPVSYSVGAKLSFGDMGEFNPAAEYFIYECDEYDRNFLAFHPYLSLITGVTWDHQDIYPTQADYEAAFKAFFAQSERLIGWQADFERLKLAEPGNNLIISDDDPQLSAIKLAGKVNRRNAWQAATAVHEVTGQPQEELIEMVEQFPGLSRRFEQLADNLYSDYAHTAEKIAGALDVARESSENVVVIYEGLHNRRQHFMLERGQFKDLFKGAKHVYWVPSYLAREDPGQKTLTPTELIKATGLSSAAEPAELNNALWEKIQNHKSSGDLVLVISAGGGGSLDEWIREQLSQA